MKISQSGGLFPALLLVLVTNLSTTTWAASSTLHKVVIKDRQGQTAALMYQGDLRESWRQNELAPLGSAALTTSGALAETGITTILHAATGSMGGYDESTEPTLQSVKDSIMMSLKLADQSGIKKVAVPLLGGGIFLNRLHVSKEKLAYEIIDAARRSQAQTDVVFVAYTDQETQTMKSAFDLAASGSLDVNWLAKLLNWFKKFFGVSSNDFFARSKVIQGSIVDFKAHGAEAIINAANMELQFGGGLSGVIGQATQDSAAIDATCLDLIKELYSQSK